MDNHVAQAVANALSTITILSCLFLKVPQIKYIKEKQSAEGIYIQAMLMETTGFTIVTMYNYTNSYSVMTYLEYPIILIQIYVLIFYTLKYKGLIENPAVPLLTMAYIATVIGFGLQILPKSLLSFMMPFCTPLSGFAKVTYIYGIVKAGNADAVSLTTWIISIATNLSRMFTIYMDSADQRLMFNLGVSAILSSGVLCTAIYYQQTLASVPAAASQCRRSNLQHRAGNEHAD